MLMVKRTPRTPPRLTSLPFPAFPLLRITVILASPIVPSSHRDTTLDTPSTEAQTAVIARNSAMTRLDQRATILTAPCPMPAIWAPHPQSMSLKRLRTRALQQNAQVAEEVRMPRINMTLDQAICLFESEQIKYQLPQGRRIPNSLVQNPRIARREHAVRLVRKIGNQIDHAIAQALHTQPIRERVHVQERVVCGFSVFERRRDGAGVQPGDKEGKMVWAHIVKSNGLGLAFDESAREGGAEVGRLRDEQRSMDAEGREFGAD